MLPARRELTPLSLSRRANNRQQPAVPPRPVVPSQFFSGAHTLRWVIGADAAFLNNGRSVPLSIGTVDNVELSPHHFFSATIFPEWKAVGAHFKVRRPTRCWFLSSLFDDEYGVSVSGVFS